ncbi:protein-L-isoaspartate O-methyltransferase [Kribbella sp. VKM Ac-2571]|uniref:rRNA adenine N-6-methyltransferase family protein n=1 Tax=Kribbella sp. VKM Ac-2571 TaxID=2512222 RepID=UPI0010E37101|nr:rRNA adenine N-6-methyltransferase family protein [Kribbella sp. VKM Ac-2571]TDO67154.1 protein-L-isoaspartate O-methyltransferase [Kribbella sp. VKM Ac-2571]
MTNRNEQLPWHPLADELVASIKQKGHLSDPRLRAAFAETPRHHFVPEYLRLDIGPSGATHIDGTVDRSTPQYLTAVYTDQALMTQTKPVRGQPDSFVWSSSSSMPSVMADMIEELQIRPGMTVLESGTGTGYNAAILCHLLGERAVTTIEIDPDLRKTALERLVDLGYHPSTTPQVRSYDRILATHAVDNIPPEWIKLGKPGAVILADLRPPANSQVGAWAKVTIDEDGRGARGRLMPPRGYFMSARKVPEFADDGQQLPELTLEEHQRRAEMIETRDVLVQPEILDDQAFALYCWRRNLDIWSWYQNGEVSLSTADGAWAQVRGTAVSVIGDRDLWAEVEHTHRDWQAAGQPPVTEWTVRVTPEGSTEIELPG